MPHTTADEGTPWTFALTSEGDIQMAQQSVQTVSGEEATIQDLKVALGTYKGTDPRDQEFGLNVFATFESLQALKREIRRTLEYDDYRHDRVGSVQSLTLSGHEDGSRMDIAVHVTLTLMTGLEAQDVELVFDLFSGGLKAAIPADSQSFD